MTMDLPSIISRKTKRRPKHENPLQLAWRSWTVSLPASAQDALRKILELLLSSSDNAEKSNHPARTLSEDIISTFTFKLPYHRYENLLIINQRALTSEPLQSIRQRSALESHLPNLWQAVAAAFGVSHVGLSGPIPLQIGQNYVEKIEDSNGKSEIDSSHDNSSTKNGSSNDVRCAQPRLDNGNNTLRAPTSFQTLYGDFGPLHTATAVADTNIRESAETAGEVFWARARQHGVVQVWSPLHTMFSHGNAKEKARVLAFPPLGSMATAVDLFAGIGYFAFCYRKKVTDVVLGWEINAWSIEGFQRGAEANGWGDQLRVVQENEQIQSLLSLAKPPFSSATVSDGFAEIGINGGSGNTTKITKGLVMFAESNVKALGRVNELRPRLPPVRHVNCGFLPTSEQVWAAAAELVDPELGGWIHVHENIAIKDIDMRAAEVVQHFTALVERKPEGCGTRKQVKLTEISMVKTYAPGVMHCVLDIHLCPIL